MSEAGKEQFIVHVWMLDKFAAKITDGHRLRLEMLLSDAIRLIEPDINKFSPTVWMERVKKQEGK